MASKKNRPLTELSRNQLEMLSLAGTVSVPRHFPELGRIWYDRRAIAYQSGGLGPQAVVRVEVVSSLRVSVTRRFRSTDVAAIFVPHDPACVQFSRGQFLLGPELDKRWREVEPAGDQPVLGIVYVPEHAPVLTEVQMGMTAAQSVDYVPPLGTDRSVDHYALDGGLGCDPPPGCGEHGVMRAKWAFCDP